MKVKRKKLKVKSEEGGRLEPDLLLPFTFLLFP
jgi:hypothetical protein